MFGKDVAPLDKHIFTSLVLEAEPALYHVARSILKDEASCEDAVQNAILKAYEKRSTLKEEGEAYLSKGTGTVS